MSIFDKLFKQKKQRTLKKTQKRSVGDLGEDTACEYLHSLGFEIVARNVQISHKEIDIVAEDDTYTLIVEVKSSSKTKAEADGQGSRPSDNVDREKALNILSAAQTWKNRSYTGREVRIDVIEVYLGDTPPTVVHLENAINTQMLYRKRR